MQISLRERNALIAEVCTVMIEYAHFGERVVPCCDFIFKDRLRSLVLRNRPCIVGCTGNPFSQARAANGGVEHPDLFAREIVPLPSKRTSLTNAATSCSRKGINAVCLARCSIADANTCRGCAQAGSAVRAVYLTVSPDDGLIGIA